MKKVIIISYFFTPCNLTASQRALGWAKYLKEFGFYPVIVTRNWDLPIAKPEDTGRSSGNKIVHEKFDDYEVYYLPYVSSLRDRIYLKKSTSKINVLLRKTLTFLELLLFNFTTKVLPYRNLYSFSKNYLEKNRDIEHLIISASPFPMFRFGYLLNRKFGIKWLADYRDDWGTNEVRIYSKLEKFLNIFERNSERKWVRTASMVSSISDHYTNKIKGFTGKEGETLLNGYFEEDFENLQLNGSVDFMVIYNGTLYNSQPVENILNAFHVFLKQNEEYASMIKFVFAGTAFDPQQVQRIRNVSQSFSENVVITDRKPRKEILEMQHSGHVLIMISHSDCKGIPSSKLYEYMAIGKPIISFPPDKDIIDETLGRLNLGYICSTENEITDKLNDIFQEFLDHNNTLVPDREYVRLFSRRQQVKKTADLLAKM